MICSWHLVVNAVRSPAGSPQHLSQAMLSMEKQISLHAVLVSHASQGTYSLERGRPDLYTEVSSHNLKERRALAMPFH